MEILFQHFQKRLKPRQFQNLRKHKEKANYTDFNKALKRYFPECCKFQRPKIQEQAYMQEI